MFESLTEKAEARLSKVLEEPEGLSFRVRRHGAKGLQSRQSAPEFAMGPFEDLDAALQEAGMPEGKYRVEVVREESEGKLVLHRPAGRGRAYFWDVKFIPEAAAGGKPDGLAAPPRTTAMTDEHAKKRVEDSYAKQAEARARLEEAEAEAKIERLKKYGPEESGISAEIGLLRSELEQLRGKGNWVETLTALGPVIIGGLELMYKFRRDPMDPEKLLEIAVRLQELSSGKSDDPTTAAVQSLAGLAGSFFESKAQKTPPPPGVAPPGAAAPPLPGTPDNGAQVAEDPLRARLQHIWREFRETLAYCRTAELDTEGALTALLPVFQILPKAHRECLVRSPFAPPEDLPMREFYAPPPPESPDGGYLESIRAVLVESLTATGHPG